jgi:cytochrome b involved in lipid metabolism
MKKFTLMVFVFFLGFAVAIFSFGLLFNSNKNLIQNGLPNTQQSNVTNNKTVSKITTKPSAQPGSNVSAGFTLTEVAQHSTKNDCYLAINNKVYNVSSYIGNHPGGAQKIISNCGGEVTGIFAAIHSNFAWDLLAKYYIGDLK